MKDEVRKCLLDLLAAAEEIEKFIGELSFESYQKDAKTQRAVEMDFLIIGEILIRISNIDESVLDAISSHADIIGFRNILAHGYDQIDERIVWNAITRHLPILKQEVIGMIS